MKSKRQTAWRNQFIGFLILGCVAVLSAGCDTVRDSSLTGQLWEGGINRCLPASEPNLKLYWTADRKDVLVTYDELREKDDSTRRRAFFFKPNLRRLENQKRPKFVEPAKIVALNLTQIAEVAPTNSSPQDIPWVKLSGDGQAFTLFWSGTDLGPYALPVYPDRESETKRFLLTPLTATGDFIVVVVVVAVVAGAVFAYSYASGSH